MARSAHVRPAGARSGLAGALGFCGRAAAGLLSSRQLRIGSRIRTMTRGKIRSSKDRARREAAETLAVAALAVPGVGARAPRPASSPPPASARTRSARPPAIRSFLSGVLDHFSGNEPLLIAFAQHAGHRSDRDRARPRVARRRLGTGHAVMAAFCRDCLARHRRRPCAARPASRRASCAMPNSTR